MPGPFKANLGAIVTVGLTDGANRFQCVFPMIGDAATGTPTGRAQDLTDGFPTFIYPNWISCLPETCQILGIQVEGMADDSILPDRINYPDGTYRGDIGGTGTPPQTSMIIALYGTTQIALPSRTAVGKMFVGPCPEDNQVGGTLEASEITLLNSLADQLNAGFVGGTTGVHWYRAVAGDPDKTVNVHVADLSRVRTQMFTQKRRMLPLF